MERGRGWKYEGGVLTGPRDAPSASALLSNRIGFTAAPWRTRLCNHRFTTLRPSVPTTTHHNSHYPLAVTELSGDSLPSIPAISTRVRGNSSGNVYLRGPWPLWREHVKMERLLRVDGSYWIHGDEGFRDGPGLGRCADREAVYGRTERLFLGGDCGVRWW